MSMSPEERSRKVFQALEKSADEQVNKPWSPPATMSFEKAYRIFSHQIKEAVADGSI